MIGKVERDISCPAVLVTNSTENAQQHVEDRGTGQRDPMPSMRASWTPTSGVDDARLLARYISLQFPVFCVLLRFLVESTTRAY